MACKHTHDTHERRLATQGNTAASSCSAFSSDRSNSVEICKGKKLTVKFIATSFLSETTAGGGHRTQRV